MYQNQNPFQPVHATNSQGNPANLVLVKTGHEAGKYHFYCGKQRDNPCPRGLCDNKCGPINGCNCFSCALLDRAYGQPPQPTVVLNNHGRPAQRVDVQSGHEIGKSHFYCGGERDTKCPNKMCDKRCGPNNGCNCSACKILDESRFHLPPPPIPGYPVPLYPVSFQSPGQIPPPPMPLPPAQFPPGQFLPGQCPPQFPPVSFPPGQFSPPVPAYSPSFPPPYQPATFTPSNSSLAPTDRNITSTLPFPVEGNSTTEKSAPLKDEDACIICMEKPKDASLIHGNSAHQCCCVDCGNALLLYGKPCPICRNPIALVVRNYKA